MISTISVYYLIYILKSVVAIDYLDIMTVKSYTNCCLSILTCYVSDFFNNNTFKKTTMSTIIQFIIIIIM